MNQTVRNIEVAGRRTSFRLEDRFWQAAEICAARQGQTINQFITNTVRNHRADGSTMASAVRVYVIGYFRDRALGRRPSGRAL